MNNMQQPEGAENQGHVRAPAPAPALAKLTHAEIVHRAVVDVRSADLKSKLRSDQCRALRANAERFAERVADLDAVTQQIVIGMAAHRGGIPDGALLDGYIDEARMVSEVLRVPLGPWHDAYGRDQGERPARMIEMMRELMVRTRCQMDPKTRMAAAGCKALRDRCHKLAESIIDLDVELQDMILAFCVRGGIAEGSQLQTYIDQARLLIAALHESYPPPLPASHQ